MRADPTMKAALLVPGFSRHERDWCIPALLDFVRSIAPEVELHVFPVRWPETRTRYQVFDATVHGTGGGKRLGWRALGLWRRTMGAIVTEHRRRPFDLVHAFWADEPGWLAAWAGRRLRRPSIISLAGGELVAFPDIDYGLGRLPARHRLVRWALEAADRVTVGSAYLLKLAQTQLPETVVRRIAVTPLGVDTTRFQPDGPRMPAPARPVILSVGALHAVKDQRLLLRAVRQVTADVWIVGDGEDRAALETLASRSGLADRVRFLGAVPHDLLPTVYRAATLFVHTSRHESQGMAVLEAAACGIPVVGTPVGVLPEIGRIACDEEQLAAAITELLRDERQRRCAAQAGTRRVRRELNLATAADRFLREYARLAARTGANRASPDPMLRQVVTERPLAEPETLRRHLLDPP